MEKQDEKPTFTNLEIFKDMGKICSKVILFLIIENSRDSVRLGNLSK